MGVHKREMDWSLHLVTRYLADLMDSAELIRNVAIAGHLHCGKVCTCTGVRVCIVCSQMILARGFSPLLDIFC